ncbi:glycoside hydrolase family 65 protein [Geoalkalibacter halelectricus]|uniref:Glycoside hydrolase family 65 protein n=1 Tax=Geoalkalibacter halelectricus TaxID=2847045 RepID=A0ABY5ZR49_9BACT|nr:glycosyl hydrolase family 65 protein [Geoalkalibacter halelectricus]UWZ81309.1 glycoside hydrolase family 65 protein [Geoalkalibacter halelectricus]
MNSWSLVYDSFDPEKEKLREALCTLGNGYFCTRGAAPESDANEVHYPGTYLAGGYNRLQTQMAGRVIENEDLVNLPNWLSLTFRIHGGEWFDMQKVKILSYRQTLDLKQGLLHRNIRFADAQGRISRLDQRRLVHMGNRHLAALETSLVAENWSGEVEWRSALDGQVVNDNVERYSDLANRHLEPLEARSIDAETLLLKMCTNQSRLEIAQAARTRVYVDDTRHNPPRNTLRKDDFIAQTFKLSLQQGQSARVEKVIALYTCRDEAIAESGLEAQTAVARAGGFEELLGDHSLRWHQLWRRFDMNLEEANGDKGATNMMILRLHIFHLLQTVSPHTIHLDAGVPSRGWHGEAYRGHIFWDELFIFPLLNLRMPEITRTLLNYRYRRLGEARAAAREAGFDGAMYPWQSGSNGREESQKVHLNPQSGNWIPDNSRLQRHVNAAIAWNVWQYFQVTDDLEYLSFFGAEMILEIARFWASLTTWNAKLERYEIFGVMGPDEYHDAYPAAERPGLDNNAYTNLMAVWVLVCAMEVLDLLPGDRRQELCEILDLKQDEIDHWDHISRRMRLVFHGDDILSQFEGYDKLEELDWETYRSKHGKVMRLDRILEAEGDSPNRYKCSKQADVLMLFYLFSAEELKALFQRLGYPFDYETIPKNIEYYLARTSHGSTLSQVVHSWVLSRSDRKGSWDLYLEALRADIDDIQGGTTPEGIHLGAMAGTVDLLQRCYIGIETRGGVLRLNPCLPQELTRLCLQLHYRGQLLTLQITKEKMRLTCQICEIEPIQLIYRDQQHQLRGGDTLEFDLVGKECS